VTPAYSLEELARTTQEWCDRFAIRPANGQVGEELTERTVRYYRTLGLLDATPGRQLREFSEKHRLQLQAIRIYQAQGIPLRRIHEELYGKSEAELLEFSRRAERQLQPAEPTLEGPAPTEQWSVAALTDDLMLVSRQGRPLPAALIRKLQFTLAEAGWPGASKKKPS
jgi:DNA-binding transcriptional MerR regulator